ncbi:MAG TPA: primosomal protein N', partial [Spirochaetia bacterium]|nr:primosomal protein N' [Spirochaetia bacterium]
FAPVNSLGLIIIDEEHEGSYKSGSTPRYHARQVAMKRALMNHCRLVMGSATPSLEAFHLMDSGRIEKLHLPERLSGGTMPQVQIVDMRGEKYSISDTLAAEMRKAKEEGRQTILLLNRRGFSYFFHCRSCGYEMTCKHCSVSLTYHKARGRMICHYCGYNQKPVDVCPECGSLDVGYSGFGTELIEEEVRSRFPDFVVSRVDTDSTQKRDSLKRILADFKNGKIDVLLGTQMVAKGLNFPGVKLVGIVCADTALHLPDFRALERTFSLIVQVSGRAGRYLSDGKVIIQTFSPDNEAIIRASTGDVDGFFAMELADRRKLGFPPFKRIIRIVFRGRDFDRVVQKAHQFARLLSGQNTAQTEILGPAECPISLIAGNYRQQLILRTTDFASCHRLVGRVLRSFDKGKNVFMEIDVDPVSIL